MKICSRWSLFGLLGHLFTFFIFHLQPFIPMMNNRVGLIRVEWDGWSLMPGGPGIHHCSSLEEHSVTIRHRAHGNRTRRARSVSFAALTETLRVSRSCNISSNTSILKHYIYNNFVNKSFSIKDNLKRIILENIFKRF
ncbi:hypothetical protein M9H77_25051 [Catharanthus roseus]|uniref:Uncharacterized protein n=1 Tax=Catharanthus roseus TaxID=4058 RepID=A0ACC0AA08_CATRO|nr:hypothetical protein M9H77_25051 [Catharanthus roseus]